MLSRPDTFLLHSCNSPLCFSLLLYHTFVCLCFFPLTPMLPLSPADHQFLSPWLEGMCMPFFLFWRKINSIMKQSIQTFYPLAAVCFWIMFALHLPFIPLYRNLNLNKGLKSAIKPAVFILRFPGRCVSQTTTAALLHSSLCLSKLYLGNTWGNKSEKIF